jgi:hypothetical protein
MKLGLRRTRLILQGTKVKGLKNEEELRKKVEQLQAELEARKRQLELPWNVFHSVQKKGPAPDFKTMLPM